MYHVREAKNRRWFLKVCDLYLLPPIMPWMGSCAVQLFFLSFFFITSFFGWDGEGRGGKNREG